VARFDAGLALVALALPFYLQPKPLGAGVYSVAEIALISSAVAFVARWLLAVRAFGLERGSPPWHAIRWSALDGVVALWVVAGGIGVLVAENFGVANREFRVVFLEPAIYYALVRASGVPVLPLVHALLLGGALVSAKAIVDWFTGTDLIRAEGVLRARGVYFSPNNLALYLDRTAPVALALALFARDAARARRALYAAAFALMLGALYLTFAKGAWLLALPAALLTIGLARGRRAVAVALLALGVLAVTLLPVLGTTRLQSLLDFGSGTTFVRLQLWQAALAMLRDHWLWGVGPDNFLYHYRTTYILPTAFAEAGLSHPHNVLLDFWTRLGLLGALLLVTLTGAFWGTAVRRYRALADGTQRALVLGTMGAMAAALAHGLIDNSFFLVDLAFALMLMLAIAGTSAAPGEA
jgi:O-antigen ligase